jgi:hypothetical protein
LVSALLFACLFLGCLQLVSAQAPPQSPPVAASAAAVAPAQVRTTPAPCAEEKPIRDLVDAFAKAYSAPDLKALEASFIRGNRRNWHTRSRRGHPVHRGGAGCGYDHRAGHSRLALRDRAGRGSCAAVTSRRAHRYVEGCSCPRYRHHARAPADGAYRWEVVNKGQKQGTISGRAVYVNNVLSLTQEEGPPLAGKIESKDSSQFVFHLMGGGNNAPALTFRR